MFKNALEKGKEDKKKYKSSTSAICGKRVSRQISTPLEKIVLVWNLNNEFCSYGF